MSFFAFALSLGAFLALMAVMASWLLRTSSAPFWVKIAIPVLAVVSAIVAPWQAIQMMGWPIMVRFSDLPPQAELLAFMPVDERHNLVDLWMRVGQAAPRAYEIVMDESMKSTLREAGQRLGRGDRVKMVKGHARHDGGVMDIDTPEAPDVLSDDAFSTPDKDGHR